MSFITFSDKAQIHFQAFLPQCFACRGITSPSTTCAGSSPSRCCQDLEHDAAAHAERTNLLLRRPLGCLLVHILQCQRAVDGQNPAPPHHFTLEGSHSNPRAPSFNVVATPLRAARKLCAKWCRILSINSSKTKSKIDFQKS